MRSTTSTILAAAAVVAPVFAQTSTKCDPTKQSCPANPALSKSVFYDFTKGPSSDFTISEGKLPTFGSDGAVFRIDGKTQAPTIASNWFMMFGHFDVVMKPAQGAGIVSSLVLQSDDLDEVDLEWVGNDQDKLQSNYFGRGNTDAYDRGQNLTFAGMFTDFHTYSVDWTAEKLTWAIDGQVLRTLTPETADQKPFNQYPQSPMQLKIGSWDAGDSSLKGTSDWAGGPVDFSKGPFDMVVKSVRAIDYSTGKEYTYAIGDGTWKTISSNGGQINPKGSVNDAAVSTAAAAPASTSAISAAGQQVSATVASTATGSAPTGNSTSGSGSASGSGSSPSGTKPTTPSASRTATSASTTPSSGANSLAGAASVGLLAAIAAALMI